MRNSKVLRQWMIIRSLMDSDGTLDILSMSKALGKSPRTIYRDLLGLADAQIIKGIDFVQLLRSVRRVENYKRPKHGVKAVMNTNFIEGVKRLQRTREWMVAKYDTCNRCGVKLATLSNGNLDMKLYYAHKQKCSI